MRGNERIIKQKKKVLLFSDVCNHGNRGASVRTR